MVRDSLRQKIKFTLLTATASGSTSFLGSIEAASTESGTRMGQSAGAFPDFPLVFTGHTTGTSIIIDALSDRTGNLKQDCSVMALPVLRAVQRNVFALPETLTVNMAWKDSTTFSGCSGAIPTSTFSVRGFRVLGEIESPGGSALVLEGSGYSLSNGEGTDGQHRVLIKAEGSEMARILVDRTTGALLDWDGQEKTTLTIMAGRSQRFTQTVRVKTVLER